MRWLVFITVAMAACTGDGETPEAVGPAEPRQMAATAAPGELSEHMRDHFTRVREARNAVIRGDLDATTTLLAGLAEHPTAEGLPEGWEPHVAELRTLADEGRTAENLEQAGRAVALVASRCGTCHEATGAAVERSAGQPPTDPGTKGHMARHAWAVERMWDTLVLPRPEAWEEGAAVLEEHSLLERDGPDGPEPLPDEVIPFAERVHSLARSGLRAPQVSARAELYGQLVAACAECHGRLDIDPSLP